MANDKTKVVAGRPNPAGALYLGTTGTAIPTDETTAINALLLSAGYLHKDGAKIKNLREVTQEQAWGGDTVLITETKTGQEITFTLIETLGDLANKVAYGSTNVTKTAATISTGTKVATTIGGPNDDHWAGVIDLKNGVKKVRYTWTDAQVTDVAEITFKDDSSIGYQITMSVLKDSAGFYIYRYTDDGVFSA
jgi:hypothetical protein